MARCFYCCHCGKCGPASYDPYCNPPGYCPFCQTQNEPAAVACMNCGKPLPLQAGERRVAQEKDAGNEEEAGDERTA